MKKTTLFFAVAGVLGLIALLINQQPRTAAAGFVPASLPQSAGDVLKLTASLSDPYLAAGGQREVWLKADLDAVTLASNGRRTPVNLALVLDRSGSMAGQKLDQCRRAARALVQQLDESDRLALITFGSDVRVLVPSLQATFSARERMLATIDQIESMGGTNMSGGLEAGLAEAAPYRSAYNVTRLVLLSDGQANEGVSDPAGLSAIARRMGTMGVTLSTVGVGLDFNERTMAALAEYGGGRYSFLADVSQLESLFAGELQQALSTVALQPRLTIAPLPGVQVAEVLGYLSEPQGAATVVRLPDFVSGAHRKIVARLLVPASAVGSLEVAQVSVSYQDVTRNRAPGSAQVAVRASVVSDQAFAANNRDKGVAAEVAQSNAVEAMRQASQLYADGNGADAQRFLDKAKKELKRGLAEFGPRQDYDSALKAADRFEGVMQNAPAASAVGNAAAKTLHSFANENR